MTAGDWSRRSEIFAEAVELPAESRAAFLDAACAEDAELRAEIERLLAADREAGDFLAGRALDRVARQIAEDEAWGIGGGEGPGGPRAIGPYRLEGTLGSGGMGTVYRASRADGDFRHEVAIKLMRGAFLLPQAVQRFHRERQILADLEHPAIARLYAGGTTEEGLPYIAMELVEGLPIDQYCDGRGLDVDARLDLFVEVCSAVAYAHRKLVVHLDLKPSNILVTAEGAPKLLDFGIARLMTPEPSADSEATAAEATAPWSRALTPGYASPELLRNEPLTTASDVYSLGVLLYRLLTGRQPYSTRELTAAEVERLVSSGPSRPPSMVVSQAAELPSGLDADRLVRRLRGDLDAIVLEALRAEPERRYPSAEALALDVRRELDGLPVSARRRTAAYAAAKFLRRHRSAVAATLLVATAVVAAAVVSVRQAKVAATERVKTERVNEVLRNLLATPDASWYARGRGHDVTMLEALEAADGWLEEEIGDLPEVEASVRATLGTTYRSLGSFDAAEREIRRALALRASALGKDDADYAQSAFDLAVLLRVAGGDIAEAEGLYREALTICRGDRSCEPDLVPAAQLELGLLELSRGEEEPAEAHFDEAMGLLEARGQGSSRLAAIGWNNRGLLRVGQGDVQAAAAAYERTTDILAALPEARESTYPIALVNLANLREQAGRSDEADELLQRARDYSRSYLGDNPYIAFLCALWGGEFATRRGDLEGVLEHGDETFAFAKAAGIDEQNLMLWGNHVNYGAALSLAGRLDAADAHLRRALSILEAQVPEGAWQYGVTKSRLGANLVAQGRRAEGLELLREGHGLLVAALGSDHRRTRNAERLLAEAGA